MSNKFLRRGRPESGRHAAARPVPAVRALRLRPNRLAQGGVVAVLAVSLCATMAATASARDGGGLALGISHTARAAAQVAAAREGAVSVATDAIEVAHAVQTEGTQAAVDPTQLAALEAATAKLNELVASVDPVAAAAVADPVATAAAPEPSATDPGVPAAMAPAASTPAVPAPIATADPAPAAKLPADEATPAPSPTPTVVPTIPPTDGVEDAATSKLRDAVAAVAELTDDVRASAEANRVAAAAAAQAAADAAAQAAAAQAASAAAAQAAADAAAAQRAAWKQSLQGYANGQIPESALCGVSFDASVRLRCDAAEQLDVLNTAYKAHFGTDLVVSGSYRSYAGQVECVRTKGFLCAVPGTSNHGNGIAVDFGGGIETFGSTQHTWMDENAPGLEWVHPSWAEPRGTKPEAWHWEYSG